MTPRTPKPPATAGWAADPDRPRAGDAATPASPPAVNGGLAGQHPGTPVTQCSPAGVPGPAAASMSEDTLERHMLAVIKDLRRLGARLLAYHTRDSRRSPEGYPDWTLCGDGGLAFRELKKERGIVTTAQHEWLATLSACGQDAGVWRPSDLISGRIGRELAALAGIGVAQ